MKVAIHQPQYLPWLGYFDKIDKSDIFVLLDDAQYKKNEWQNRNRIKTATGWQWLTVPVLYRFGQKIFEVKINNATDWRRKHWQSIVTDYSKAKYFAKYKEVFENIYERDWQFLSNLNIYSIKKLAKILAIDTKIIKTSDLKVKGKKSIRLVNICKKLNADTYLSGIGAKDYLDLQEFKKANIAVEFQKFSCPTYSQLFKKQGFSENLSIIDLLFNYGEESLSILRGEIIYAGNHSPL